jgi:hypothetical protein
VKRQPPEPEKISVNYSSNKGLIPTNITNSKINYKNKFYFPTKNGK